MSPQQTTDTTLAPGDWGAVGITLIVAENGGSLEFDCAHATIDEAIVVASDGTFSVKATYTQEAPGPVRRGHQVSPRPATMAGTVREDAMTATIFVKNSDLTLGPYTLERGSRGRLRKCR
jgi:hypothetical protein